MLNIKVHISVVECVEYKFIILPKIFIKDEILSLLFYE